MSRDLGCCCFCTSPACQCVNVCSELRTYCIDNSSESEVCPTRYVKLSATGNILNVVCVYELAFSATNCKHNHLQRVWGGRPKCLFYCFCLSLLEKRMYLQHYALRCICFPLEIHLSCVLFFLWSFICTACLSHLLQRQDKFNCFSRRVWNVCVRNESR